MTNRMAGRLALFFGVLLIGLLMALGATRSADWQAPNVNYKGLMTANSGGQQVQARIYHRTDSMRMEMETQQGPAVMILDRENSEAFMLMTRQRIYMPLPISRVQVDQMGKLDPNADLEHVSDENVNGVDAEKYRVSRKDAAQPGFEGHIWMTEENIIVRMDGTHHRGGQATAVSMNLTELEVGDLEDGLFQIPEGYQNMMQGRQ